ncbi:MAG: hypothetical protein FJ248_03200 [Nitrospira sp.]|nr:hypothetical protein [Nitrospira sp.]
MRHALVLLIGLAAALTAGPSPAEAAPTKKKGPLKPSPAVETAQQFTSALAAGDQTAVAKLDFACSYRLAAAGAKTFPPDTDPLYTACWEPIGRAHDTVIQHTDQGVHVLWPGKDRLVFFSEDFARYTPSVFVMEALGLSPPGGGLFIDVLDERRLPPASFRIGDSGPTLAAPATLVRLSIGYKDPLLAPASHAPGLKQWTDMTRRPRQALKSVTLKWIVLSDLKKLGFPSDVAVVNLPVKDATATAQTVPFAAERSGYEQDSARWWQADDAPGVLIAAVARASLFPELRDRLAMLNRVLLIDASQAEALTLLSHDLYTMLLDIAARTHRIPVGDQTLFMIFNELYWNTYAQTVRWDLSLGMDMGGLAQPSAADFLHRLLPAMQQLETIRPQDFENRLRLGSAYRWNIDQFIAIATHEALLKEIPPQRTAVRARVLNELAWSRIAKVAWNRTFSDTGILQAYKEAEEALQLTDVPLDKFVSTYTMAYSLLFMPQRDNQKLLEKLTEARTLFLALRGASAESWKFLLSPESLKMVLDADPIFAPLLTDK